MPSLEKTGERLTRPYSDDALRRLNEVLLGLRLKALFQGRELSDDDFITAGKKAGIYGSGDTGRPLEGNITVFRVEFPSGMGPFNAENFADDGSRRNKKADRLYMRFAFDGVDENGNQCWDCVQLAARNNEKAGITDLAFYLAHGDASYACGTLSSLADWFPKGAREFMRNDYRAKVVEYELQQGSYILPLPRSESLIFDKPKAIRVRERDLITFEPLDISAI